MNVPATTRVWLCDTASLAAERFLGPLDPWLDDVERSHAEHLRCDGDRRAYRVAHALRRAVVAQSLGRPPGEVTFVTDSLGKPSLTGDSVLDLRVSLSHTRGWVAVAAGLVALGVDVEASDPSRSGLPIEALSAAEQHWLRSRGGDMRQLFLLTWTAKEAFAKALGLGLYLPMHEYSVLVNEDGRVESLAALVEPRHPWSFASFRTPALTLTVAAASAPAGGQLCVLGPAENRTLDLELRVARSCGDPIHSESR